ncbi:MAG: undecaprenyl-diphosphate phosphatase [Reyranella sp.]
MDWLHTAVLAVVQGITEFLPISSSAHLILVPKITGWADQGLMIDVALHAGTLAAVILYFHKDTARMIRGGLRLLQGDFASPNARLALCMVAGTLPIVAGGFLLKGLVETELRNLFLIGLTTISFGVILWAADRHGEDDRMVFANMTVRAALLIGLAQVLALVPGVSRSGITMTAALFLGYRRDAAARFSMLLSIPTIIAAGSLVGIDLWKEGNVALGLDAIAAAGLAFVVALAAIAGLMAWLRRSTFLPFVIYRVVLGLILLIWVA